MENNIDLLMRPAITETKKSVVKESKKHSKMEKLKERNSFDFKTLEHLSQKGACQSCLSEIPSGFGLGIS